MGRERGCVPGGDWRKGKGRRECHPRRVMCIYMCVCMDLGPQPCFLGCFFAISSSKDQKLGDADDGGILGGRKAVDVHMTREAGGKRVCGLPFLPVTGMRDQMRRVISKSTSKQNFPLQKKSPIIPTRTRINHLWFFFFFVAVINRQ